MEKAIVVGLRLTGIRKSEFSESLAELTRLADTAGAKVEQIFTQFKSRMDPACLIGRGKAFEIKETVKQNGIQTVIFDNELKPVQQKNLEEIIEAKIIDRTRLILDIFAKRARSCEGMLQVERAQLEYFLPRLSKKGIMLDSQTGGIGTRGPGERKLETDQRILRDRIAHIDRQIKKVKERRDILRQSRIESGQPLIAIVGYTNSGKSTLLNYLTKKNDIYADDKLFATLDPTTRQIRLPGGRNTLFTDTVGFINKLPHSLIAAFSSTLEETQKANCLLHMVDIAHPNYDEQISTVSKVLKELNAGNVPIVVAYNKCDIIPAWRKKNLRKNGAVLISAKTGEGVNGLLTRIESFVSPKAYPHILTLDFSKNALMNSIYALAVIKNRKYTEKGIKISLECSAKNWELIKDLLLKNKG